MTDSGWWLTTLLVGTGPPPRSHRFDNFRELTADEHRRWMDARTLIGEVGLVSSYATLDREHERLIDVLADVTGRATASLQLEAGEARAWHASLDAAVMAWLTATRSFQDRTRTVLVRRYGSASVQVDAFDTACSRAFDSSWDYRFAYKLRDCAQHCGSPLGFSVVQGQAGLRLRVGFDRDHLLSIFDRWGAVVTPGLTAGPEFYELEPLLAGAKLAITRIWSATLLSQEVQVREAIALLRELNHEAATRGGPAFVIQPTMNPDGSGGLQQMTIGDAAAEMIESILVNAAALAALG